MNNVHLTSRNYSYFHRGDDSIYIALKWIREVAKNEEQFLNMICFDLSHEFMHHLLYKNYGSLECHKLDLICTGLKKLEKEEMLHTGIKLSLSCKIEYILKHYPGGF